MYQNSKKQDLIKVRQISSVIGCFYKQRRTLIGLGLNGINNISILKDTPAIRGMIKKVGHLVKIENILE